MSVLFVDLSQKVYYDFRSAYTVPVAVLILKVIEGRWFLSHLKKRILLMTNSNLLYLAPFSHNSACRPSRSSEVNDFHVIWKGVCHLLFVINSNFGPLSLTRDCNPGIPAVFADSESRDWRRLNPGISGLQKLAKIVLFRVLNDKNKHFSVLWIKYFMSARVLLCAVALKL